MLDYKIVEQAGFYAIGKAITVSTKEDENLDHIPRFWDECSRDGTLEKLCADFHREEMLGVCTDFDHQSGRFTYMIAVRGGEAYVGQDYLVRQIPANTWAVFTSTGPMPDAIQAVWRHIFQEWLPSSGYEHADAPDLEVYPPGDPNSVNYRCEVWIPIIKK